MSEKELKPCPFCGGEAEYKERGNEYSGITETSVICKKCCARQIHKWRHYKFRFDFVRSKTIDTWNRRVDNDEL